MTEVPTRSHRQREEPPYQITAGTIGGSPGFFRTPGKINLNTVWDLEVFSALCDPQLANGLNFTPDTVKQMLEDMRALRTPRGGFHAHDAAADDKARASTSITIVLHYYSKI